MRRAWRSGSEDDAQKDLTVVINGRSPRASRDTTSMANDEDGQGPVGLAHASEEAMQGQQQMAGVRQGMPFAVWVIIANEFCERFTFYGVKTVLYVYFVSESIGLDATQATVAIHSFVFTAYLCTLLGAVIADSWLGRFRTILYLSLIYCAGSIVLAASATIKPNIKVHYPDAEDLKDASQNRRLGVAVSGLLLLALGTGGIKPCVSAFGADQVTYSHENSSNISQSPRIVTQGQLRDERDLDDNFDEEDTNFSETETLSALVSITQDEDVEPVVTNVETNSAQRSREEQVSLFFSYFYFAINAGSLLSALLTPIIRRTPCQGQPTCYPLAFAVPAGLMLVSTILFISGAPWYHGKSRPGRSRSQSATEAQVMSTIFAVLRAALKTQNRRAHRTENQLGEGTSNHWIYAALQGNNSLSEAGSEHAVDARITRQNVDDVKRLLSILRVFLVLPVFWALYDQMGSTWMSQALQMDSNVLGLVITADQMTVLNSVMVLGFIPLFRFIYRVVKVSLISRMLMGMWFVGLSFVCAGVVQQSIEASDTENKKKTVSIAWQIPQYVLITAGEILFSLSGLEFAYANAPVSMRSVCQSAWLLTVAGGNLIVILVVEQIEFEAGTQFFFFAAMIAVASTIFYYLARGAATSEASIEESEQRED